MKNQTFQHKIYLKKQKFMMNLIEICNIPKEEKKEINNV